MFSIQEHRTNFLKLNLWYNFWLYILDYLNITKLQFIDCGIEKLPKCIIQNLHLNYIVHEQQLLYNVKSSKILYHDFSFFLLQMTKLYWSSSLTKDPKFLDIV